MSQEWTTEFLEQDMEYAKVGLDYFMSNNLNESKIHLQTRHNDYPFSSMGYSLLSFMEAVLYFDSAHVQKAIDDCDVTIELTQGRRRGSSILETVLMFDLSNKYTIEQLITEVVYAHSILIKALLSFVNDNRFTNLIKSAIKINQSYRILTFLHRVVKNKTDEPANNQLWDTLCTCVYSGYGAFSIMISLLPSKISACLSMVGFTGDLKIGLEHLLEGYEKNTIISMICGIAYSSFNLIISHAIGFTNLNLERSFSVVDGLNEQFPTSVIIKFLVARKYLMMGNVEKSIEINTQIVSNNLEMTQFALVCYWDLIWSNSLFGDYKEALKYAILIKEKSKWSTVTCSYIQISLMLAIAGSKENLSKENENIIDEIIKDLPAKLQTFSGKSVPMEKYSLMKCNTFIDKKYIPLAFFEVLYIHNWFGLIYKQENTFELMFKEIEAENQILNSTDTLSDDYFTSLLLLGTCHRLKGNLDKAEDLLQDILSQKKFIKFAHHLLPCACIEIALIAEIRNDYQRAAKYMAFAKKIRSDYILEYKILSRIRSLALQQHYKKKYSENSSLIL